MATTTVKPSGQGGDYTTLSGWEAGQQKTLTEAEVCNIDGDWSGGADTTAVTIDGWSGNSATNTITIQTTSSARHSGTYSSSKYVLSTTFNSLLSIKETYVSVVGIQIYYNLDYSGATAITVSSVSDGEVVIDSVLFWRTSSAYNGDTFVNSIPSGTCVVKIRNCLAIIDSGNASDGISIGGGYGVVDSNTIIGGRQAISDSASDKHIYRNNITNGSVSGFDVFTPLHASTSNNCSDIASNAPGSNSRTGSVSFVDAANDNYHISNSDTVALGYGINLSATFTTDIDGETRTGTWDIGADQHTAAAKAFPFFRQPFTPFLVR